MKHKKINCSKQEKAGINNKAKTYGVEERMELEKVEKHSDRAQEGYHLLLLHTTGGRIVVQIRVRHCPRIRITLRLQNSPHFCVFKYVRAGKQKVWNEAEERARLGV